MRKTAKRNRAARMRDKGAAEFEPEAARRSNADDVAAARRGMNAADCRDEPATDVSDMLCGLLKYCRAESIDFDAELERARGHFDTEIGFETAAPGVCLACRGPCFPGECLCPCASEPDDSGPSAAEERGWDAAEEAARGTAPNAADSTRGN